MPALGALFKSNSFKQSCSRSTTLLLILFVYLLFGGFVFQTLEYDARNEIVDDALDEIESERHNVLDVLWAHTLVMEQNDWMQLAHEKLDIYEKKLIGHAMNGIDTDDDVEDDDNPWSLIGSLFYAYTCITTIGYGSFTPVTTAGRIVTIVYSLIGVPLCLIYLGECGKLLTMILKALMKKKDEEEEPSYGYSSYTSDEFSSDFDFSITVSCVILFVWLAVGAVMFDLLEDDWDFMEALYFCFITASTLGFGDYTPDTDMEMLIVMVYNLATLALCSLCFTVVQNALDTYLTEKCEDTSSVLGRVGSPIKAIADRCKSLFKKAEDKEE